LFNFISHTFFENQDFLFFLDRRQPDSEATTTKRIFWNETWYDQQILGL